MDTATDRRATALEFLPHPGGGRIAMRRTTAAGPAVLFLGGLRSDMAGAKATHVDALCRRQGLACVRFDYRGHGESDGRFEEGTVSRWLEDAELVLEHATDGPLILVGSSLGGWIGLLLALAHPDRIAAFIGISTAADFTEFVYHKLFNDAHRAEMQREGRVLVPDCHGGPPFEITRDLIEDGRRHLLLGRVRIPLDCPVRMIHARHDRDVPWDTGLELADLMTGSDVQVTIVKDGDHQLARPADLSLLDATLMALLPGLVGKQQ